MSCKDCNENCGNFFCDGAEMAPQRSLFNALGMTKEELDDVIINKAKLWLDSGAIFGESAALFQRVVLACPRETLEQAMQNLAKAING